MERSPSRAVGETLAMTVVALAALLGLRAIGILAPVPIRVLVGITVVALAISTTMSYWKKVRLELGGLMRTAGEVRDRDIAIDLLLKAGVSRRAAVVSRLETERRRAVHDLLLEIRRWESQDFSRKWRSRLELST